MRTQNHSKLVLWVVSVATVLFALIILWCLESASSQASDSHSPDKQRPHSRSKQVQIDLDKAIKVALPELSEDLKPAQFKTGDGKVGWVMRLPGSKPIATPAYWDGKLFIGGGYGSHEFYAINAESGAVVWQIKTSDDGPTASVVEDGCVAFNTESCTVVVCDAKTGNILWQEWLGDPLMSQPAIYKGRLYMAHPAGQRRPQDSAQVGSSGRGEGHRLLCADLRTGKHLWDQQIPADVISAPIINDDRVYFTCYDGTSFCLDADGGRLMWKRKNSGTSAPLVVGYDVVLTMKVQERNKQYEGLKRFDSKRGYEKDKALLAKSEATYLEKYKGGLIGGGQGPGMGASDAIKLDSSVGFSSAPPAANLETANKQVGVSTVVGAWAYQGSRAAYSRGRMMNAQGRFLNCLWAIDGRFAWRAEVNGAGIDADSQVFSPPALGEQNLYLCSVLGHLLSVGQVDGKVGFLYMFNQPMTFQPALARGDIYVGTGNGLLICLKTGDSDVDDWYAWGGNAQHNKTR